MLSSFWFSNLMVSLKTQFFIVSSVVKLLLEIFLYCSSSSLCNHPSSRNKCFFLRVLSKSLKIYFLKIVSGWIRKGHIRLNSYNAEHGNVLLGLGQSGATLSNLTFPRTCRLQGEIIGPKLKLK